MNKNHKSKVSIWSTIDPECVKQRINRITVKIEAVLSKYEPQIISDRFYSTDDSANF